MEESVRWENIGRKIEKQLERGKKTQFDKFIVNIWLGRCTAAL